nr:BspA family leucine-rich repeat surface protein [Mycoplasmopsis bovis]
MKIEILQTYLIYLKLFSCAENFNQDLSNWKTSNVTDMSVTFYNAKKFNSPLNSWDTYNVTNMQSMFYGAAEFNQ